MQLFLRFLLEEDGPTAVEYAVLLALILLAIVGAVGAFGSETGGMWGDLDTDMHNAGLGN